MPFNGSGVFGPIAAPDFPAVSNTLIKASQFNANMYDVFAGLTNCFTRDGQSPALNNLPMGGFRLTGLGNPTAATDAVNMRTLQNYGAPIPLSGAAGGPTTYTANAPFGLAALTAGQFFTFTPNIVNTGASTLNVNGIGAISVVTRGGTAVAANQLMASSTYLLYYNGTNFRIVTAIENGSELFRASSTAGASANIPHGTAPTTPNNGDIWTTTAGMFARINGVTQQYAPLASPTFTGTVTTAASATGGAGFNVPHGTAPSAPNNGDIWSTTTALFARINGATKTVQDLESAQTISGVKTHTAKLNTVASASGAAGLNIPAGSAPSAPTNGDLWGTTTSLDYRLNGKSTKILNAVNNNSLTSSTYYRVAERNGGEGQGSIHLKITGTSSNQTIDADVLITKGSTADCSDLSVTVVGRLYPVWLKIQFTSPNLWVELSNISTAGEINVAVVDESSLFTKAFSLVNFTATSAGTVTVQIQPSGTVGNGVIRCAGAAGAGVQTPVLATMGANSTFGGALVNTRVQLPAGLTGAAPLNFTTGGVAPSSPANGDIWTTTSQMFAQLNGATREFLLLSATGTTVGAAGGASALPATPTGYVTVNIGGTDRKIPYYAT